MSFDIYNKRPKLIEPKLLKYFNDKIKNKEIKELESQNNLTETWQKKLCTNICCFIKENYGFFIIITLILLLLYVRYIEVNKRKNKVQHIIKQINKEKEIEQFIELQEINKKLSYYH